MGHSLIYNVLSKYVNKQWKMPRILFNNNIDLTVRLLFKDGKWTIHIYKNDVKPTGQRKFRQENNKILEMGKQTEKQ